MSVTFCKGEESKQRVLDAALALFIEQGYEKTTMRQIIAKSGVLNGSVYYAFKNKEGIFENIFDLILERMYADLDSEGLDAVSFIVLPAAIELYSVSSEGNVAEMIYNATRSWNIFKKIVLRYEEYICGFCETKGWPVDRERFHMFSLTLNGMTATFVEEIYHGEASASVEKDLRCIIDHVCSMMNMPPVNGDEVIGKLLALLKERTGVTDDLSFE